MTARYIPDDLRERVAVSAGHRCGYCLSFQDYVPIALEIEHIIPAARGGTDDEDNLWLACAGCNKRKGDQVEAVDPETLEQIQLYDPRRQIWSEHFRWSEDGALIVGLTPCGRATVQALQLNRDIAVVVRRHWIAAGWHPPPGS